MSRSANASRIAALEAEGGEPSAVELLLYLSGNILLLILKNLLYHGRKSSIFLPSGRLDGSLKEWSRTAAVGKQHCT